MTSSSSLVSALNKVGLLKLHWLKSASQVVNLAAVIRFYILHIYCFLHIFHRLGRKVINSGGKRVQLLIELIDWPLCYSTPGSIH